MSGQDIPYRDRVLRYDFGLAEPPLSRSLPPSVDSYVDNLRVFLTGIGDLVGTVSSSSEGFPLSSSLSASSGSVSSKGLIGGVGSIGGASGV